MTNVKTLAVIDCCAPRRRSDSERQRGRRARAAVPGPRRPAANQDPEPPRPADDDSVCVCELVPALGLKQPTVSYHLKQLAQAGLVERERRGTFAYYRLVPGRSRARRGGAPVSRVLFVCVRNAGRSQMAEALFTRSAGSGHEARSAGSDPASEVHPEVVGCDARARHRARWADTAPARRWRTPNGPTSS